MCAPGIGGTPAQGVGWAIAVWDSLTEVNAQAVCANYNVFIQYGPTAESWLGATFCWQWGASDCDAKAIHFNTTLLDLEANRVHAWKAVACHEVGHVGGLGHRGSTGTSCMDTFYSPTNSVVADNHDVAAIAQTYPR